MRCQSHAADAASTTGLVGHVVLHILDVIEEEAVVDEGFRLLNWEVHASLLGLLQLFDLHHFCTSLVILRLYEVGERLDLLLEVLDASQVRALRLFGLRGQRLQLFLQHLNIHLSAFVRNGRLGSSFFGYRLCFCGTTTSSARFFLRSPSGGFLSRSPSGGFLSSRSLKGFLSSRIFSGFLYSCHM